MTENLDVLAAAATPTTKAGTLLLGQIAYHEDPPRYLPGDLPYWDAAAQIKDVEDEARAAAIEERDRLRAAAEAICEAFPLSPGGTPRADAIERLRAATLDAARAAAPSPDRAGLREALVDSMEAHEDGRRGGAYPHLGQTNDIRRFVDWIVDWMEKFTPSALLSEPPVDVERIVRLTVHTCRGRLLTAPADQEAAVKAALARLAEPEDSRRG